MTDWYVDADAAGGGDGTEATPWNTVASISLGGMSNGDTIYFSGDFAERLLIQQSPAVGLICSGYRCAPASGVPTHLVRLNGSDGTDIRNFVGTGDGINDACITSSDDTSPVAITTNARLTHSTLTGSVQGFRCSDGTDGVVVQNCTAYANENGGFLFEDDSDNVFMSRCISHLNFQPSNDGNAGDGFGFTTTGNVTLSDCVAFNNSDDGFDSFGSTGTHVLNRCVSYGQGVDRWSVGPGFAGDGNGYKMGSGSATWTMTACVAFANEQDGMDANTSGGPHTFLQCSTAHNTDRGFEQGSCTSNVYTNCISITGGAADTLGTTPVETTNTWDLTITDPKFISTTDLRLDGDSPCIAVGTKWWAGNPPQGADGLRFYNTPSIGAYEPRPESGYLIKGHAPTKKMLGGGCDIGKLRAI